MRALWTALLSATFLGSAIMPGWCPEPAKLTQSTGRSTGATTAVITRNPTPKPRVYDPKTATPAERRLYLMKEVKAGNIKSSQDARNFIATGDPKKAPPPIKSSLPAQKPPTMTQATWDRLKGTSSKK